MLFYTFQYGVLHRHQQRAFLFRQNGARIQDNHIILNAGNNRRIAAPQLCQQALRLGYRQSI